MLFKPILALHFYKFFNLVEIIGGGGGGGGKMLCLPPPPPPIFSLGGDLARIDVSMWAQYEQLQSWNVWLVITIWYSVCDPAKRLRTQRLMNFNWTTQKKFHEKSNYTVWSFNLSIKRNFMKTQNIIFIFHLTFCFVFLSIKIMYVLCTCTCTLYFNMNSGI